MRRPVVVLASCCIGFSLVAGASATIKPSRGMSGIALGMTPAQVQAKLGRPGAKAPGRWYYPRLWVGFRGLRVVEVTTVRSAERLANGLGVDSTEAQVRAALPQVSCAAVVPFRRCRLGSSAPGSRVTDFMIGRGRVLQITIQQLP